MTRISCLAVVVVWALGAELMLAADDAAAKPPAATQSRLSRQAGFVDSQETSLEWYYNIALTPWLHVSPDVQYIFNPGGDSSAKDAVMLGVRVKMSF